MEKVNNEIIDSVCSKLGNALNELSEIRKLHFNEVKELQAKLYASLQMMKSKDVTVSNNFVQGWDNFIKETEKWLTGNTN